MIGFNSGFSHARKLGSSFKYLAVAATVSYRRGPDDGGMGEFVGVSDRETLFGVVRVEREGGLRLIWK